jgi:hypothetical protein
VGREGGEEKGRSLTERASHIQGNTFRAIDDAGLNIGRRLPRWVRRVVTEVADDSTTVVRRKPCSYMSAGFRRAMVGMSEATEHASHIQGNTFRAIDDAGLKHRRQWSPKFGTHVQTRISPTTGCAVVGRRLQRLELATEPTTGPMTGNAKLSRLRSRVGGQLRTVNCGL